MDKKRGIVLSGGGARGAYQIGVLKVLKTHGFLDNIYAVSGASVGSLNAMMLALDELEKAEQLWFKIDGEAMFKQEKSLFKRFTENGFEFVYEGVYPNFGLEKLIEQALDYEKLQKKKVFVATSYVSEGEASFWEIISVNVRNLFSKTPFIRYSSLSDLSEEDVKKTLMASCAIPIVFQPIMIKDKTYYDGGILDNAPCQPLYDLGCDELIVIDLFRMRKVKCPSDIELHQIKPSKNLRGIMDFSKAQIKRRFELGLHDGEAFVKKYLENHS